MRRADTGDAARHDFPALGNEGREHSHVFIVDVVDLFHAEPAYFLAPEILLLGGQRFIAAGGPHGPANRTSASLFGHIILLPSRPPELPPPAPRGGRNPGRRAGERRVWAPRARLRPPWHVPAARWERPAARACALHVFRALSCAFRSSSAFRRCGRSGISSPGPTPVSAAPARSPLWARW